MNCFRLNFRTAQGITRTMEVMAESSAAAIERHIDLAQEGERIEALPVRDPLDVQRDGLFAAAERNHG